ncbi:MAG TPA: F0F1 ATP synthase subunit delta [Candidatus Acidoferrales bacterium]|nr:F0F1 ATP synthase subunit delta [Candidatus Acidoferrales bacterium]
MELSWPAFVLEIINFLVLVWILKRFLYKPVLEAIGQRKAVIDKTLADAHAKEAGAQALVTQYQNRLAEWENEKEKLRAGVTAEIAAQRAQMMKALENSLKQEREKTRVLEERRLSDIRNNAEESGVARGVEFTARLMARAAGPDLQSTLIKLALEDLPCLPDEKINALRSAQQPPLQTKVTSAFPLSAEERAAIVEKIKAIIHNNIAVEFAEDSRLLAGVRISFGPWVMRANLEDELEFFAQAVRHESRKL